MLANYKASDPPIKCELLLAPTMLKSMLKLPKATRDIFIVHLITGAFFYALHSCEYTKMNGELRTTIITTDRVSFFKHSSSRIETTSFADSNASSMCIIFKIQKTWRQRNWYQTMPLIQISILSYLGNMSYQPYITNTAIQHHPYK